MINGRWCCGEGLIKLNWCIQRREYYSIQRLPHHNPELHSVGRSFAVEGAGIDAGKKVESMDRKE